MAATKAGFAYACTLLGMIVALSMPAVAEDADLKKQVEQINSAYMESYNKQDAAGIVAQYVPGAVMVNPAGPRTDIAQYYDAAFKDGPNQLEIKTDQVWPLGPDAALGMGKFQVTGKDQSGAPASSQVASGPRRMFERAEN